MPACEGAAAAVDWLSAAFGVPRVPEEDDGCQALRRWLENPWVIDGLVVAEGDGEAPHAPPEAAGATAIRPPGDSPEAGTRP